LEHSLLEALSSSLIDSKSALLEHSLPEVLLQFSELSWSTVSRRLFSSSLTDSKSALLEHSLPEALLQFFDRLKECSVGAQSPGGSPPVL